MNAILARSGQVCVAATRVYVQSSIAKDFIAKYTEKMKAAASDLGDPQDSSVKMGPLVDEGQLERVKAMIERGKGEAELVIGGVQYGQVKLHRWFLNMLTDFTVILVATWSLPYSSTHRYVSEYNLCCILMTLMIYRPMLRYIVTRSSDRLQLSRLSRPRKRCSNWRTIQSMVRYRRAT